MNLVIGKNGFLASYLQKHSLFQKDFIFSNISGLDDISLPISKVIILTFDNKWKKISGYDCDIEKKILKRFGSESVPIEYISTSKVYGQSDIPLTEEDLLNPSSYYAENKIIAENFITNNFKNFHIYRVSNLFNETGGANKTFFNLLIENLKNNIINFDVSSQSVRDFITTNYVAKVLYSSKYPTSGIFNLSSSIPIAIKDIVEELLISNNINKKDLIISYGDVIVSQVLDNNKLTKYFKIPCISKKIIFNEVSKINAK